MNKKNRKQNNKVLKHDTNNKLISKNKQFTNIISKNKLRITMLVLFFVLFALIIRLFFLQFVQSSSLKESAYNQQTINRIISPKRGTIYDSTGKKLALSAQVDTITINPTKIVDKDGDETKTKAKKEQVAKALSDIFELDYNEVLEKVNSNSSVQTIVKKVEQDKIDQLKKWMSDNKISVGINIDEDTKRTYPYNNLASNLIGFCGADNNGLQGIELKWDSVLTGTPGKIVTSKDAIQEEIPDQNQTYIPAENGSDIILSIDFYIQSIVEKYLKQAVQENNCARGGTAVAMNPNTGDILAMASYPDYNLNSPFEPNTTALKSTWDTLDQATKTSKLNEIWKNRIISDTYEPGSTFKLITSATALEENITVEDKANDFTCLGYEEVNGIKISCWSQNHRGGLSLRDALKKSCNPSFMQLGKRIGAETLYKYYGAFGFFEKTGIALPGESKGLFFSLENVKNVELATMSFGQRITVTPIQLVTAISAIANDGVLMQPRIVKQIINTETGATTNINPVEVRQVISKTTSERMRNLMESVVTDGSGRYAQVAGYSIGGKTGTSEPPVGKEDEGYVASYVAISPTENPEICLLVALYKPQGKNHQGGQICGPVVSQMLSEILPYLGLTSSNVQTNISDSTDTSTSTITVPDIRNKTVTEAQKILTQLGFKTNISINGDKNELLVTDQVPKPGTSLLKNSIITLYSEENNINVSVTVPNLKGMTAAQATNSLNSKNLNISIEGTGKVISQDIVADTSVPEGTVVKVILHDEVQDTQ